MLWPANKSDAAHFRPFCLYCSSKADVHRNYSLCPHMLLKTNRRAAQVGLRHCRLRTHAATNMVVSKRSREDDRVETTSKHAKLEDDRIAAPAVGANLIQVNGKTCTHEVAWPPGQQGSQLPPSRSAAPAAKAYAFSLDPFQQTAINSLETGRASVTAAYRSRFVTPAKIAGFCPCFPFVSSCMQVMHNSEWLNTNWSQLLALQGTVFW